MVKRHTEAALDGWIRVGLFFLPGVPLWFVWEEFLNWSGGYSEIVFGIVTLLQFASVLLLHRPLMKALIKLCDQLDAQREKRRSHNENNGNPAQDALRESLRDMPKDRLHELAAMGAELARQDAEQNLRVRKEQMQKKKVNKAETGNARMRFFMMDGFTPALEPKPGAMLLLTDDGSWVSISPREVLADERSPEVSEQKFRAVVAAFDCAMPNKTQNGSVPNTPSQSPTGAGKQTPLNPHFPSNLMFSHLRLPVTCYISAC